jgi:hypothetical protein
MPAVVDEQGREVLVMDAFAFNGNFEVKATGYKGTAPFGATTALDFAVGAEDRYINGLRMFLKNHAEADTIGLQVVDVNNVLGYGAGLVLKTFGINWNVDETQSDQGQSVFNYAARLPAGVFVRLNYTSTGAVDVVVKLNLLLHKKVQ